MTSRNRILEGNKPARVAGGRGMVSGPCGWDTLFTRRDGAESLHPLPFPLRREAGPRTTRVEGCQPSQVPNRRGPSVNLPWDKGLYQGAGG